ncbi:protein of unknown function [Methanocaldococcus lauensis]|uniref:Uncharacterized protein n=1 Tax=Methanocaldococcus lauensis TaxID=2546128 RepID=A0A8D6PPL1_9EURY|nr:protein of unknown function [Methanocaldococcus lauensis]CAB3289834.1 protein of unknown function [Methanocaldococcus lauensis]
MNIKKYIIIPNKFYVCLLNLFIKLKILGVYYESVWSYWIRGCFN